jgi:transposase
MCKVFLEADVPDDTAAYLNAWCTSAVRSQIKSFANPIRRICKHFDAIADAIRLGLSNSGLYGTNACMRVIHRHGLVSRV